MYLKKNSPNAPIMCFVIFESVAVNFAFNVIQMCEQLTPGHIPSPTPALTAKLGSPPREILLVNITLNVTICKSC